MFWKLPSSTRSTWNPACPLLPALLSHATEAVGQATSDSQQPCPVNHQAPLTLSQGYFDRTLYLFHPDCHCYRSNSPVSFLHDGNGVFLAPLSLYLHPHLARASEMQFWVLTPFLKDCLLLQDKNLNTTWPWELDLAPSRLSSITPHHCLILTFPFCSPEWVQFLLPIGLCCVPFVGCSQLSIPLTPLSLEDSV